MHRLINDVTRKPNMYSTLSLKKGIYAGYKKKEKTIYMLYNKNMKSVIVYIY